MTDEQTEESDYRICSGGFVSSSGDAVRCEHGKIGPHRPPVPSSTLGGEG